uniref:C4-dicarboxylate transport protein n=1 Tax=Lygus hesperus TaxID=30085 RepID=A0A0A9VZN1_LYGHE
MSRRSTNEPVAGPSSGPDQEILDDRRSSTKRSPLFDVFILFAVPTNVIIPAIYLMMPAFKALMAPDKLPGTKSLSIAIILVCSLILCYTVPYFIFWLLTKAHQYGIIKLRKYVLKQYGLENNIRID